jgi:hypothetical protein
MSGYSNTLTGLTNNLIRKNIRNDEGGSRSKLQIQSQIHPEILFRYNTINLLISRRGVGKTFTVMKELIKLSQLPNYGAIQHFYMYLIKLMLKQ